jgi:hypothetical protein
MCFELYVLHALLGIANTDLLLLQHADGRECGLGKGWTCISRVWMLAIKGECCAMLSFRMKKRHSRRKTEKAKYRQFLQKKERR